MDGIRIEGCMVRQQPDLKPMAMELAEMVIAFFQDEKNEQAYQQWKKARDARKGA